MNEERDNSIKYPIVEEQAEVEAAQCSSTVRFTIDSDTLDESDQDVEARGRASSSDSVSSLNSGSSGKENGLPTVFTDMQPPFNPPPKSSSAMEKLLKNR